MKLKVYVVSRREEPKANLVAPATDGNVFSVRLRLKSVWNDTVIDYDDVELYVEKSDYERFVPGTEREFELR